jgi:ABC-type dipeptide/oligopeptide/nickel transport system ATPase component
LNTELYAPTGKSLHKVVCGQSGSGKSYFLEATSKTFLKSNKSENFRMIYFSPKNEGYVDLLPRDKKKRPVGLVFDLEGMVKSVEVNTLTVFYPDPLELEETMDDTINSIFDMKALNPQMKCTLIIDDAQVFLDSRRRASDSMQRLALLGRSREINAIFVSHSLVMNKSLEAQVETLIFFTLPARTHWKSGEERYGFNPEPYVERLRENPYSFIHFDVRTAQTRLMNPIETGL